MAASYFLRVSRGAPLASGVMHLKHRAATVVGVSLLVGLLSCDKQIPQRIIGTLSSNNGPSANVALRLYPSFRKCDGKFSESQTDSKGAFQFGTESTRGGVDVVVQEIALCAEQTGTWVPLWSTVIGGGAVQIDLTCKPRGLEEEFCELKARYSESDA